MNNKPTIRAIDLGYGNVKLTLSDMNGIAVKTMSIPAEAHETNHTQDTQFPEDDFIKKSDVKLICVNERYYKIGQDILMIDNNHCHRNLIDDYIEQDEYLALTYAALDHINESVIDLLVVGLPVRLFKHKSKQLQEMLTGLHTISQTKNVEIKEVRVIQQPMGALINYASKNKMTQFKSDTHLIIDVGYHTMDWIVSYGIRSIDERSGGNQYGMSKFLAAVLEEVRSDKKINTNIDNINFIDQAVKNGILKIRSNSFPIQPYIDKAQLKIREGIQHMANTMGNIDDVNSIILSGGGASIYKNMIIEQFPDHIIYIDLDAIYSNVIGFHRAGELLSNQRIKKAS